MNRYQLEVAEFDRKHRSRTRVLSLAGAASLIVLALWSAGVSPTGWFSTLQGWLGSHEDTEVVTNADGGSKQVRSPPRAIEPYKPADDISAQGTDASASSVPLRLLLVETSPGRNEHEGTARIGSSPENPQTYAAGALLANGAKLTEIHESYVILQRGDRKVRLNKGDQKGRAGDALLFVGGQEKRAAPKPTTADPLVAILRPSPVFEGNQVAGIEVFAGSNAALFSQLGLQSGDVLVSLNGAPVVDMKSTLDLLRELTTGIALTASVQRKGALTSVSLDGTLILAEQERARLARTNNETAPPF